MDKQVILLGLMGEKFGTEWTCSDRSSIKDIFKLIECQNSGFRAFIIEALELGLDMAVVKGDELITKPEEIFLTETNSNIIYISLVPSGSGGFGKILAAIAIIIIAIYLPGMMAVQGPALGAGSGVTAVMPTGAFAVGGTVQMALFSMAANLAISGVTELLMKAPQTAKEEAAGTIFNGPANTMKTGAPIPVLYGHLLIGGAAISVDYRTSRFNKSCGGVVYPYGYTVAFGYNGYSNQSIHPCYNIDSPLLVGS